MTAESHSPGGVESKPRPQRGRHVLWWLMLLLGLMVLLVGYRLAMVPDLPPPFDVSRFVNFSIPDDRNAFTYYRQAKDRLVPAAAVVPNIKERPALFDRQDEAVKGAWSKADEPLRKWLQMNQPALDLWRRGTACADGMEVQTARETLESLLPVSQSLRELAKFALLRASRTAAEKRPVEAWPWYRDVLRSSRHVGQHSDTLGRMIGVVIHRSTIEPILRWSSRPELTASDLRQALADVEAIDQTTAPSSDTLKAEYLVSCKTMEAETAGWKGLPYRLIGFRQSIQEALSLVYANWVSQVDRPRYHRLPAKSSRWGLFEIDPAAPPDPMLLSPAEIEQRCGAAGWSTAASIVTLVVPGVRNFIDSADRERAGQAGLVLGIALELYHREHGRFPDALDNLVKEKYLKSIPADPFGKGEPFHYRCETDPRKAAILWSVWTDGIDQNGTLEIDPQREGSPGDKIYRIAPPR